MKMVIVFDTDDQEGMMNTVKIVDQLAIDYLGKSIDARYKRTFSKIEFIKMLREFGKTVKRAVQDDDTDEDGTGLRFAKVFSEKVWDAKENGGRYP
tara:strand:- start:237 stop:524 length:288 start_codon:yes stop_codon:yes gene_type:complete